MKIKYTFVLVTLAIILSIIFLRIYFLNKQRVEIQPVQTNNDEKNIDKTDTQVSCTRTTRLENKPVYDRALSLIGEKYLGWDKEYLNGEDSYSYFPSQLVNCIKIDESNLKNTTGEEGYFIFHDDRIEENYYPITVDQDYKFNDEAVNALLLIHEITHVQQYIDLLNGKPEISCIDKETEAFHAQLKFYSFQFPETRKSIDLRIQNDDDLNSQLQIIKEIQDLITLNINKKESECLYGPGKSNVIQCVDKINKNLIRNLLLQNEYYIQQCNI